MAKPEDSQFKKGQRIGKYEILGLLSVGGMAELYLASLAGKGGFRKFVALKRVLPEVAANESFLKMFLDEARITASLSHANIAQVYELAEDPDTAESVLAMEFVAGQNLQQVVKRARSLDITLPMGFVCRVIHDVLLGLHSAHAFVEPTTGKPNPVVHRDINPRNLMVTYTGGVKIIDFGIAKARGRLDQTQVGMVKGTVDYMSPEQIRSAAVDGRSDLFALSVVLHELLTGQKLWGNDTDAATMFKIVQDPAPSPADVNIDVPPALVKAVMKGLEKDPAKRWATGRDYARALDRALDEVWDEEQLAKFMAQLFEDKIAFTRELLDSGSTKTSDLRLMTTSGDDDQALGADLKPPPTTVSRGKTPAKSEPPPPPPAAVSSETQVLPVKGVAGSPPGKPPPRPGDVENMATQATLDPVRKPLNSDFEGGPESTVVVDDDLAMQARSEVKAAEQSRSKPGPGKKKLTGEISAVGGRRRTTDSPVTAPPRRKTGDMAAIGGKALPGPPVPDDLEEVPTDPRTAAHGRDRAKAPPAKEGGFPLTAALIGLIVVLLLLVGTLVFLEMKGRKAEEPDFDSAGDTTEVPAKAVPKAPKGKAK